MESATERPAWAPRPDAELQQPGAITPDMTSGQRLYHHSHATANHPLHCLEFRVLQRMNILRLQNKLATLKGTCSEKKQLDPADEDTMGRTLHEYGQYTPQPFDPIEHVVNLFVATSTNSF